jgi:hypothetical protein
MNGENTDNKSEKIERNAFEYLKQIVDALDKLFSILFSYEELIVKDISINVRKQQTLGKFLQSERQPQIPSEIAIIEVSVKLGFQESFGSKFLADILESIEKAGLKASLSIEELDMKINVANIPLA